jgi:hypothetical protein
MHKLAALACRPEQCGVENRPSLYAPSNEISGFLGHFDNPRITGAIFVAFERSLDLAGNFCSV